MTLVELEYTMKNPSVLGGIREVYMGLVPYFGGLSLDSEPDFVRYWNFCGTFIDVRTDKNKYKRGTNI